MYKEGVLGRRIEEMGRRKEKGRVFVGNKKMG